MPAIVVIPPTINHTRVNEAVIAEFETMVPFIIVIPPTFNKTSVIKAIRPVVKTMVPSIIVISTTIYLILIHRQFRKRIIT
jgi:hypothetical protein